MDRGFSLFLGPVVDVGVEGQLPEEFGGQGIDDPDVEVVGEQDDVGSGVGPSDADVVVSTVVAQGDDGIGGSPCRPPRRLVVQLAVAASRTAPAGGVVAEQRRDGEKSAAELSLRLVPVGLALALRPGWPAGWPGWTACHPRSQ
jgi:hypothetical protein